MALPIKVVDINTAGWSDHRNQNHGGIQQTTLNSNTSDNGTFYNLGDTSSHVGIITGYTGQAGHKLLRVRCYLQRVGSPTGNVFIEVRAALSDTVLDLALAPWGVSKSFPVSSIPTTGKNEVIFTFPVPVSLPSPDSTSFGIALTISAQGDSSNYIKVYRGLCGDRGTFHAYGAGNQVWTGETGGSALSLSKVVEISQSGAFVFAVDTANNKARAYKTTNNGTTWTETGSAPDILTTSGMRSIGAQGSIQDLDASYVSLFTGGLNAGTYKSITGSWTFLAQKAFGALGTNASSTGPIGGGRRANGNLILVVQGATETVMGSARRRIKLAFWNGTTFSAEFDVAGSTNTPNSTLPGTAVDFDLRWSIVDPNGDCHIIYSKSDTSTLQYRKFKADNTFTTISTLNGAVASATANYPVGQGTIYYQSPDFYLAIPYVDNTSNTLKVARCKTTITETSANWTLTEIVAASAEVGASNPAVLMADNGQGGKLFCWRVAPTTKGLKFTNDAASDIWAAETDWKGGGQTIGGISGFYIEDGIALVYLEESTSPDELRYDRL